MYSTGASESSEGAATASAGFALVLLFDGAFAGLAGSVAEALSEVRAQSGMLGQIAGQGYGRHPLGCYLREAFCTVAKRLESF